MAGERVSLGLSIGACRVYGVTAEASCVWNRRHAPPKRRCGCGFYCLSTLAEATALSCATDQPGGGASRGGRRPAVSSATSGACGTAGSGCGPCGSARAGAGARRSG